MCLLITRLPGLKIRYNSVASPWLCNAFTKRVMSSNKTDENCTSSKLRTLFSEAVRSVQPDTLIDKQIKILDGHLWVNDRSFALAKPCYVVGFGKAVLGMAVALERALADRLERGLITVPKGIFQNYPQYLGVSDKIVFMEGAENNIPDKDAVEGAVKIKELVEKLDEDDLLVVLISGGGSALLPLPKPPVTLEEKQAIIRSLSRGGASIQELNTVRKQLSLLKGGGLAKLAYPAKVVSLILSDVIGDPTDVIASGPTVISDENPQGAVDVLKKYGLFETAPGSVKTTLASPGIQSNHDNDGTPVTPPWTLNNAEEKLFPSGKTGHVSNFIIGTNRIATNAAKTIASGMGWQCVVVSHMVEENVNRLAELYAQLAYDILNGRISKIRELLENMPFELEEGAIEKVLGLYSTKKMLLIFAGEPTVLVTGSGKGGRNQQLALAFSLQLNKQATDSRNCGNISFLSAGTDGIDGPTDAAGAIGYSGLVGTCARLDINPEEYLKDNDSYTFFNKFRDGECLVKIGHTGTNVMDLHFLLIEPCG